MSLTSEEMIKISKAIFYAHGTNLIGVGWLISKETVFNLLNDYSPDCKAKLEKKDDFWGLSFEINEEDEEQ